MTTIKTTAAVALMTALELNAYKAWKGAAKIEYENETAFTTVVYADGSAECVTKEVYVEPIPEEEPVTKPKMMNVVRDGRVVEMKNKTKEEIIESLIKKYSGRDGHTDAGLEFMMDNSPIVDDFILDTLHGYEGYCLNFDCTSRDYPEHLAKAEAIKAAKEDKDGAIADYAKVCKVRDDAETDGLTMWDNFNKVYGSAVIYKPMFIMNKGKRAGTPALNSGLFHKDEMIWNNALKANKGNVAATKADVDKFMQLKACFELKRKEYNDAKPLCGDAWKRVIETNEPVREAYKMPSPATLVNVVFKSHNVNGKDLTIPTCPCCGEEVKVVSGHHGHFGIDKRSIMDEMKPTTYVIQAQKITINSNGNIIADERSMNDIMEAHGVTSEVEAIDADTVNAFMSTEYTSTGFGETMEINGETVVEDNTWKETTEDYVTVAEYATDNVSNQDAEDMYDCGYASDEMIAEYNEIMKYHRNEVSYNSIRSAYNHYEAGWKTGFYNFDGENAGTTTKLGGYAAEVFNDEAEEINEMIKDTETKILNLRKVVSQMVRLGKNVPENIITEGRSWKVMYNSLVKKTSKGLPGQKICDTIAFKAKVAKAFTFDDTTAEVYNSRIWTVGYDYEDYGTQDIVTGKARDLALTEYDRKIAINQISERVDMNDVNAKKPWIVMTESERKAVLVAEKIKCHKAARAFRQNMKSYDELNKNFNKAKDSADVEASYMYF